MDGGEIDEQKEEELMKPEWRNTMNEREQQLVRFTRILK